MLTTDGLIAVLSIVLTAYGIGYTNGYHNTDMKNNR